MATPPKYGTAILCVFRAFGSSIICKRCAIFIAIGVKQIAKKRAIQKVKNVSKKGIFVPFMITPHQYKISVKSESPCQSHKEKLGVLLRDFLITHRDPV